MIRKIVIRNGKKYIVNTAGWNDDVGPGGPAGTLWMQSTDGNWYTVSLTGTSGSAAISINQTPLTLTTNDIGYQYLYGTGNSAYQVYLSGNAGSVTINVNPSPISTVSDYKPYFNLQSTDGYFYQIYLSGSSNVLTVNQNSGIQINDGY